MINIITNKEIMYTNAHTFQVSDTVRFDCISRMRCGNIDRASTSASEEQERYSNFAMNRKSVYINLDNDCTN